MLPSMSVLTDGRTLTFSIVSFNAADVWLGPSWLLRFCRLTGSLQIHHDYQKKGRQHLTWRPRCVRLPRRWRHRKFRKRLRVILHGADDPRPVPEVERFERWRRLTVPSGDRRSGPETLLRHVVHTDRAVQESEKVVEAAGSRSRARRHARVWLVAEVGRRPAGPPVDLHHAAERRRHRGFIIRSASGFSSRTRTTSPCVPEASPGTSLLWLPSRKQTEAAWRHLRSEKN